MAFPNIILLPMFNDRPTYQGGAIFFTRLICRN